MIIECYEGQAKNPLLAFVSSNFQRTATIFIAKLILTIDKMMTAVVRKLVMHDSCKTKTSKRPVQQGTTDLRAF